MAQRSRKKKRSWLKTTFIFVFTPIAIWLIAFLLWLYGYDLIQWLGMAKDSSQRASESELKLKRGAPGAQENTKTPQEKILDEERNRLEEILRERR